jgi:SNF2 family DNA or RNA helicase
MLTPSMLHDYQKSMVNYIVNNDAVFGILDMGLGKTISTLTPIKYLQRNQGYRSALILAPLRVCYSVWPEEITIWEHTQDMTCCIVHGPNKKKALDINADIYVSNYESIEFIVDSGLWKRCDILVLDESSYVKSHKTKRFKLLKKICGEFKKVILLTGTPSGSGDLWEIFTQTYILDQGERLGESFHWFKKRYYSPADYNGYRWELKKGARKKIESKIKDISVVYRAEDHLSLPDLIHNKVSVSLPPKARKAYDEFEKDFLYQLSADEAITVANAAVLSGKLRQVCAGGLYTDDQGAWEKLHEEKLNALEEIIESTDKPVLVFFWFRFEKEMILKRFKRASFLDGSSKPGDLQAIVDAWNGRRIKLLCCHPASAGHGLNLQKGSGVMVWLSLTWSLEQYQQAIARLYRQGQRETCIVHSIICENSVDGVVMKSLINKGVGQDKMINALKQYAKSRLL